MQHKLSEIQITPIKPINGLVGFANLVLNDCLFLGNVAIFTRPEGGFRLSFPTRKVGSKNLYIFNPITRSLGQQLEQAIIEKFEEVTFNSEQ
jgi:stage V sporulation protein G